jgi:hypothetical protein
MLEDVNTVNDQGGDSVATKPTGSRSVEELGIFVSLEGILNLGPSPPVEGAFLNRQMEGVHRKRTQPVFHIREGAPLFQKVEDLDEDTAVFITLGGR